MKQIRYIHGDDYGECSLWDISKKQFAALEKKRIDSEYGSEEEEAIIAEMDSHMVKVTEDELGFVPDWAVQLAKSFGVEVGST